MKRKEIEDSERCIIWIKIYIEGINKIINYEKKEELLDYEKSIGNILDNQNRAKDGIKWLKQKLKNNSLNDILFLNENLEWFRQRLRKEKILAEDIEKLAEGADTKWQRFEKENKEEIKKQALEELKDCVHSWEVAVSFLRKSGFEMFMDDYPNDCDIRDSAQRLVEYLEREGIEIKEEKEKLAEADDLLKSLANEAAKVPGFSLKKEDLPPYTPESHWWWYIGDLAKENKQDAFAIAEPYIKAEAIEKHLGIK
ncbi:MAG: hypothetical protein AB1630_09930 [bacterium]